jgi:hypothetical protein
MDKENNSSIEDEDDGYATPPSSPVKPTVRNTELKSAKGKEAQARSVKKKGATKVVRQIHYLQDRIDQLASVPHLCTDHSFFVSDWSGTKLEVGEVSKHKSPRENRDVLLARVSAVLSLFRAKFPYVSGVYLGKSVSMPVRFNKHKATKKLPNQMLVMICLITFTMDDVAEEDILRWDMTPDALAMQYERLVTDRMLELGWETFHHKQEPGGGGRAGSKSAESVSVYMLIAVSTQVPSSNLPSGNFDEEDDEDETLIKRKLELVDLT